MFHKEDHRRGFLQSAALGAGGVLAAGWLTKLSDAATVTPAGKPIRLGGPVPKPPKDPEELALAHRKLGYRAAICPMVALDDTQRIRDFAAAFAKHGVMIAEVGRWCNLLDADPAKRAENLKKVTDGLALAEAIGARCCVDIAGSFNPQYWDGPDPKNLSTEFFDAAVENARKIIDAVNPRRAKFCYEVMGWALPDSPDSYLEMLKAIDRPGFAVHFDPCNLINSPQKFYHNTDLLNECFDKLGPYIVSCHGKDLTWDKEMNIHFREVPLGTGALDYRTYLRRLAALPDDVPLVLEHMKSPEDYAQCRKYLFDLAPQIGVSFEQKRDL